MELATTSSGLRPAAFGSAWLWAPVLGVGLVAVLAGHLPPGVAPDLARQAALRLLGGDLGLGWTELAALAWSAGWIVAKPLCVIGAILWLEFRFSAGADRKNYRLAFAAQALIMGSFLGLMALLSVLGAFPEPLIRVEAAGGTAALLLVSVPAFVLSLLVIDFFGYWHHRLLHRVPFLWRFHALHHSLDVDVANNFGHPVDQLIAIPLVGIPTAFLIGVSQEQLYLLVAFTSLQAQINHTRLPIHLGPLGGKLLCDNRYHFIHHSRDPAHRDKNFADRFPFLDMLFGTYVAPGEDLVPTGLPDKAPPRTLGDCLMARFPERADRP